MATFSLPLFPLSTVLFPDGVLPLQIFEVRYLDMISRCLTEDTDFGVVLLTHGHEVRTAQAHERFVASGTLASVHDTTASAPGYHPGQFRHPRAASAPAVDASAAADEGYHPGGAGRDRRAA